MPRYTRSPQKRIRHGGSDAPFEEIRVVNPSRGLNQLVADILTDNKDASDLSDIAFSEGGIAGKRPGYKSVGTGLVNPSNGMGVYKNGTTSTLMQIDSGYLKQYNGTSWVAVAGSVTVDVNASIHLTSVDKKMYVWDGINGGSVFDGTNFTKPGTMPKGKFSVIYKDYHIVSGVEGQDNRVYISGVKEPSRFTRLNATTDTTKIDLSKPAEVPGATVFTGDDSPNAIDVNRYDGDKVTGFGFFQDALIIFKENSTYQMAFNDQNIPVVQRITDAYGCLAHGSICTVENDLYFLSREGIMVLGNEPNYYASIRTNELSSRIKDTINSLNFEQIQRARSIFWDNKYLLSVPMIGSTKNNLMIVYDKRFYSWSVWKNINASAMAIYNDEKNRRQLVFTDSQTPTMNQFTPGIYNDNGEAIFGWWTSRAFHGRKVDVEKFWKELRPIFRKITGTVDIDFFDENGSFGKTININSAILGGMGYDNFGALLYGTSITDTYTDTDLGIAGDGDTGSSSSTDNTNDVYSVRIGRDARTFKFRVSNNNVDENFGLLGFIIQFQNKDSEHFDGSKTYR